jgi:unsaturated chondroitin disaccharide hydrolase
LGLRFKEKGQYLRSFVADESLFIYIMMNVGIIFYAAQQTNDADLLRRANQHCLTTRRYLVRGDGSTSHEGLFNTGTGEFIRQSTHQGWRDDSAWARGLTWALYGFGTAYRLTGDARYLQTSQLCADFYLRHTSFSDDAPHGPGVPPNDYDDPRQPILADSSAAAIAASGLLNLSELVQDRIYAERYRESAFTILHTLAGSHYLAHETPGWEGILKHGVYHRAKNLGVDESVMWGEHFFVEAVDHALTILSK